MRTTFVMVSLEKCIVERKKSCREFLGSNGCRVLVLHKLPDLESFPKTNSIWRSPLDLCPSRQVSIDHFLGFPFPSDRHHQLHGISISSSSTPTSNEKYAGKASFQTFAYWSSSQTELCNRMEPGLGIWVLSHQLLPISKGEQRWFIINLALLSSDIQWVSFRISIGVLSNGRSASREPWL